MEAVAYIGGGSKWSVSRRVICSGALSEGLRTAHFASRTETGWPRRTYATASGGSNTRHRRAGAAGVESVRPTGRRAMAAPRSRNPAGRGRARGAHTSVRPEAEPAALLHALIRHSKGVCQRLEGVCQRLESAARDRERVPSQQPPISNSCWDVLAALHGRSAGGSTCLGVTAIGEGPAPSLVASSVRKGEVR